MAENQNAELAAEFAPHFGRSLLFAGIATLGPVPTGVVWLTDLALEPDTDAVAREIRAALDELETDPSTA
jgi:hypothetical protein